MKGTEALIAVAIASVCIAAILAVANHSLQTAKWDQEFRMGVLKSQGLVCERLAEGPLVCRKP